MSVRQDAQQRHAPRGAESWRDAPLTVWSRMLQLQSAQAGACGAMKNGTIRPCSLNLTAPAIFLILTPDS